jgi:hypothetical protein
MKKRTILLIIVGLIGAGIAYWLISPLFIDREVSETVEDIMEARKLELEEKNIEITEPMSPEIISSGSFIGLGLHNASGTARLIKIADKYYVRFEDDFNITNGPDLFVHFGSNDKYDANARLGRLKGNIGGQNYEVPSDINPADYNEVWIWCRAFAVPFGKAVLE